MGVLTATPTANLTANGTNTANGTMAWTPPAMPSGVTEWDSVVISGSWAWNGKGGINSLTIGGTNAPSTFSITLSNKTVSSVPLTCKGGNKNATGNSFVWSNLRVTYTYTRYVNVSIGEVVHGSITLSQSGRVPEGTRITITATPDRGYEAAEYRVNGAVIPGGTFTADHDSIVTVLFAEIQQKIYWMQDGVVQSTTEVYRMIGGMLVLQTDLSAVFQPDKKYIQIK